MSKVEDGASTEWKHLYEAAVLELDRTRLLSRIAEARRAILQELESAAPEDRNQAECLNNALQVLHDLDKINAQDGKTDAA